MRTVRYRIGTIEVGKVEVHWEDGTPEYVAYRVGAEGYVQVGTTRTQVAAANLVAHSLIAKSMDASGTLRAEQRLKLSNLLSMLRGLGLKDICDLIEDALK